MKFGNIRANGGTRTPDRRITNPTHYQLCYVGASQPSNQPFFNKLVKRQAKIESNGNFVEGLKAT